jgi:hypothetical protein
MTQPSLRATMLKVESDAFSAKANLASGWSTFRRALLEDATTARLTSALRDSLTNIETIVTRVYTLATVQIDHRYANPYDIALAAYLWALSMVAPGTARLAAEVVLGARQTWWARETASALLANLIADEPYAMFRSDPALTMSTATSFSGGSGLPYLILDNSVVVWDIPTSVRQETVQSQLLAGSGSIRLSLHKWKAVGNAASKSQNRTVGVGLESIGWRLESVRSASEEAA